MMTATTSITRITYPFITAVAVCHGAITMPDATFSTTSTITSAVVIIREDCSWI